MMSNRGIKFLLFFFYAALIVGIITIDQITKQWALAFCSSARCLIPGVWCDVSINRGIAWGLFHGYASWVYVVLTIIVMLTIFFLVTFLIKRAAQGRWIIGEVLVVGGALSNLIDRVLRGGVVDFIVVGTQRYSWPSFNVADVAVVVGALCMIVSELIVLRHHDS